MSAGGGHRCRESLYSVRQAVAAHASAAGMSEAQARDVMIAVQELAANAVRHGRGGAGCGCSSRTAR